MKVVGEKSIRVKNWVVTIRKMEKAGYYAGTAFSVKRKEYHRWNRYPMFYDGIHTVDSGIPQYVIKAIEKEVAD